MAISMIFWTFYLFQILEQRRGGRFYVLAVVRDVGDVDDLGEYPFGFQLFHEFLDAGRRPRQRAAVGRVVARDLDVVRQSVLDVVVPQTYGGHHAVDELRFHGSPTSSVRGQYHLLGGKATVRVGASQLPYRMADNAVGQYVDTGQYVHQTYLFLND